MLTRLLLLSSKLHLTDAQLNPQCFVGHSTVHLLNGQLVLKFICVVAIKPRTVCVFVTVPMKSVASFEVRSPRAADVLRWNTLAVSH